MDIETITIDDIEQQLLDHEAAIARRRAAQMTLLREVDRRQGADGSRVWVVG